MGTKICLYIIYYRSKLANFATINNTWRLVSYDGIPQWGPNMDNRQLHYLNQYNNNRHGNWIETENFFMQARKHFLPYICFIQKVKNL